MGRRKAVRAREPNGRIQRERETAPGEVRRLRDAALAGLRDPEWGTELGRLFLVGKIKPEQFAAGKRWTEAASRYSHAVASPHRIGSTSDFDRGRGEPVDVDSDAGRAEAERHKAVMERFEAAHRKLVGCGMLIERAVRSICEDGQAPDSFETLQRLHIGLSTLADHWQLTAASKSANVR